MLMRKQNKSSDKEAVGKDPTNPCIFPQRVARNINFISFNEKISSSILAHTSASKVEMNRELGLVQGLCSNIALEVKTSQAIRNVLNVMRDAIYDLQDEGGIDEMEANLFIKVIESKMKRLLAAPPILEEPTIHKILGSVTWVDRDEDLIKFLTTRATMLSFPSGGTIIKAGEKPGGFYVILSGLVKVESKLPSGLMVTDFLATGNVVGEISCLTLKPRSATLTCETVVKVLYLSTKNLNVAFEKFSYLEPPLEARLWRMTAIRLSFNVLSSLPSYRDSTKEAIIQTLENFQMTIVEKTTFDLTSMKNVILITGRATFGKDSFISPCYIPVTISALYFTPDQIPKPIVFYEIEHQVRKNKLQLCAEFDLTEIMF